MEKDSKTIKLNTGIFTKIRNLIFGSKKRLFIVIVVILLLVFGASKIFGSSSQTATYQTANVTRGTVLQTVSESGNVAALSQAGVGSPTTGIIDSIDVKDGQYVNAGQNLFRVKSTATAQEIASAYASYESAISSANSAQEDELGEQATLEKDRAAVLTAQDNVNFMDGQIGGSINNSSTHSPWNQLEIDTMNSSLTSARETFTADQMKDEKAGQAIDAADASEQSAYYSYEATQDSTVTAPFSGVVANVGYKSGDEITASSGNLSSDISTTTSSSSNNPVLYIGSFSKPYVKVQASEVDVTGIKPGEQATITLNAFQNETFAGTVDQVDEVGTVTSGVVTFNVFVDFSSAPSTIKPGMSATVNIQTGRADNALMVPSADVQTATDGSLYVNVLQNNQPSPVTVTTGISSDSETQITSGLTEGETVVVGTVAPTTSSTGTSPFSALTRPGGFGGGGFGGGARGGGGGGRGGGG